MTHKKAKEIFTVKQMEALIKAVGKETLATVIKTLKSVQELKDMIVIETAKDGSKSEIKMVNFMNKVAYSKVSKLYKDLDEKTNKETIDQVQTAVKELVKNGSYNLGKRIFTVSNIK